MPTRYRLALGGPMRAPQQHRGTCPPAARCAHYLGGGGWGPGRDYPEWGSRRGLIGAPGEWGSRRCREIHSSVDPPAWLGTPPAWASHCARRPQVRTVRGRRHRLPLPRARFRLFFPLPLPAPGACTRLLSVPGGARCARHGACTPPAAPSRPGAPASAADTSRLAENPRSRLRRRCRWQLKQRSERAPRPGGQAAGAGQTWMRGVQRCLPAPAVPAPQCSEARGEQATRRACTAERSAGTHCSVLTAMSRSTEVSPGTRATSFM